MTTPTKLIPAALATFITLTGCGPELTSERDTPQTATQQQALSGFLTSPKNYYYLSGGVYWFQDDYSGKWCTGATAQTAVWEYGTTCSWNGWSDSSYHFYCNGAGAFWQNAYYHYHCP